MPTRLILVRHGSTEHSQADRFCGRTDPPLSAHGETQAAAASRRLTKEPLAAVYASTMRRALRTAEIIAAPHSLSVTTDAALREIDHGHWEGLEQDDVKRRLAPEFAAWTADPLTFAPEGGETGLSVLSRALPALRTIVERWTGRTALVVSHKATIRLAAAALLGLDPRRYRDRLALDAASVSVITFETFDRPRLEAWNQSA
jgi:probable phosphoglycerate mutase